ncbi:MAG: VOC family protein [Rhizobiaceae bacterium]|nr:VOC family protein [Rhizobiaceae bacterium]
MFNSTISMLRVKDARAAETFYCDKLGFQKSWEYDPGDGDPIFVEVTRDQVQFHLSEHEGDGPPGVQLYVNVADAKKLYDELISKNVVINDPPYEAPWEHMVFELQDLDGNTLRIGSPI